MLLEDTRATVHCLVRASSQQLATERLKKTLLKWGLWTNDVERRVVAISGDLGMPKLGLDPRVYSNLVQEVDTIYHCATGVNHLESYTMAKPVNVDGVRELLQFATWRRPKLVNYISTLNVFGTAGRDTVRVVSETTPCHAEQHLASQGYSASKCVGERLFALASERGIPCNIFRLGLIWADASQGRYDELQREYRVLKSCLLSGYGIWNYRYEMAPTPVDYAARSVVCLSDRYPNGGGVFHVSSSTQKVDGLFERCNEIAGTYLELLSHYEWIARIKQLHSRGKTLPIVPLVESLFSLSEESFRDYQRSTGLGGTRFDCEMTQRELEQAGIPTPALDDSILSVTLRDMLSRDEELRSSGRFRKPLEERAYVGAGRS
jgi:thioester reductase-like protein